MEYFKDANHSWIKTGQYTKKCTKCKMIKISNSTTSILFYRDGKIVKNEGCCWHGAMIKK